MTTYNHMLWDLSCDLPFISEWPPKRGSREIPKWNLSHGNRTKNRVTKICIFALLSFRLFANRHLCHSLCQFVRNMTIKKRVTKMVIVGFWFFYQIYKIKTYLHFINRSLIHLVICFFFFVNVKQVRMANVECTTYVSLLLLLFAIVYIRVGRWSKNYGTHHLGLIRGFQLCI